MNHPGRRIARERKRRGLSQAQVVEATGVKMSTLGRIERGKTLDSKAIPILEDFFGLEPDEAATEPDQDDTDEARYTLQQARRKLSAWDLLAELADRLRVTEQLAGAPLPKYPHEWDTDEGLSRRIRDEQQPDASSAETDKRP